MSVEGIVVGMEDVRTEKMVDARDVGVTAALDEMKRMLADLIAGWESVQWLGEHGENLDIQCQVAAMSGAALLDLGHDVEMAQQMMCPAARKHLAQANKAQAIVDKFTS